MKKLKAGFYGLITALFASSTKKITPVPDATGQQMTEAETNSVRAQLIFSETTSTKIIDRYFRDRYQE